MSTETKPENSASSPSQATTNLRELLGWCGAMTYMFCMMYGYQIFIADGSWFVNGSWIPSFIMMAFAVSITVFSFRFGRELIRLSKIAGYTTPAAIAATMVIGVLPDTPAAIVSVLAAVLMAPAISRRAYGVIRTSDPKWQITRYMIGWAAALTMFAFWVIAALPRELTFLIPALFAVPAWIGVRRGLSIPDGFVPEKITRLTGRSLVVIVLTVLVMVWFNLMTDMLLNNLFSGGDISSQSATVISTLLAWIPLALGIMLFAVVSDRGYERAGFIVGMGLFLISIVIIMLLNDIHSAVYVPLAIANAIGSMYVVFFACSFPIYFLLKGAKRPVFVVSAGCIFFTAFQSVCWQKSLYLPESLIKLGTPLYVSASISAVVFIILVYFLFEHYREKSLAAVLYAFLHGSPDTDKQNTPEEIFTPEEIDVALLLIEGKMRSEITRSLHLTASEADSRLGSIRSKILTMGDPDPVIAAGVAEYKLSPRETDVLRCLRREMTNTEIAAELYLSEETVKTHVRNLLKKLKIANRKDILSWEKSLVKQPKILNQL